MNSIHNPDQSVRERALMTRNSACRVCKGKNLTRVFSFGPTPPANAFLQAQDLDKPELWFPLDVYFCKDCSLLQLVDIVSPELLFQDYVYVSSTSPAFMDHFRSFAEVVTARFGLGRASLVVDIGSNDGILLKPFRALGVAVLGIDPAVKIAQNATEEGIETLPLFFNPELALRIAKDRGQAQVITGTNVFAHINDLDLLLEGVKILLAPDGVFIIEVPYLVDFLQKNLFDTVYHEHLSYFSLRPLTILFQRAGMEIFNVERVNVHGGSIRVFVKKAGASHKIKDSVAGFREEERAKKLDVSRTYLDFAKKVEENKRTLVSLLQNLKAQGKKIVGYGAPAKGNTLLNYFKIGTNMLEYIVDDSSWKQGLYTPGTHIPVVAVQRLASKQPDYVLILAWNFTDSIMSKLSFFREGGGKFIIPVPTPRVE